MDTNTTTAADTATKKRARKAMLRLLIKDRAELEGVASRAAATSLKRDAMVLQFDQDLAELKEKFKKELDELNQSLQQDVDSMESYCITHREQEFKKEEKSIFVLGHKLAFRDSPGKVECIKGVTQDVVKERLLAHPDEDFADQFLKHTTVLNKDAIGDLWEQHGGFLEKQGLKFSKPELFSFTPDRTKLASTIVKTTTRTEAA